MRYFMIALIALAQISIAQACPGGVFTFESNGVTCVLNAEKAVCGGVTVEWPRMNEYFINVRNGTANQTMVYGVQISEQYVANNPYGIKLVAAEVRKPLSINRNYDPNNPDAWFSMYSVYEIPNPKNPRERIRVYLEGNRGPNGDTYRSVTGGTSEPEWKRGQVNGVGYDMALGC